MIPRIPTKDILLRLESDSRVVVILGPRQSGKTFLAEKVLEDSGLRWLKLNGDNPEDAHVLTRPTDLRLKGLVSGYEAVFIDEAQRIPEIGLTLKRLHDQYSQTRLLVTGSSSLEIGDRVREALTGRTWTYTLFPISVIELGSIHNPVEIDRYVDELMVLGTYPALFSLPSRNDKIAHLKELSGAYLYKDILDLAGIRSPRKIRDLLRLLAYQVGSEVSFHELGAQCGLSSDTVVSYIDLLEKSFVVFRLGAWNKNLRKEVSKKNKIYFVDNGVRNAIVNDFSELGVRGDGGALWENFLVSERKKRNSYARFHGGSFFWRLSTGAEIDYVENADGHVSAFEFKWGRKTPRLPASFAAAYPNHSFEVINRDNWQSFAGL